jgi:hypothetical protein
MKAWVSFDSWGSSLLDGKSGTRTGDISRVFTKFVGNHLAVVAEEIDPPDIGVEFDRTVHALLSGSYFMLPSSPRVSCRSIAFAREAKVSEEPRKN